MTSLLNEKLIITHNFQVILHAQHAVETTAGSVAIRSPSADTDIFVIAVDLLASPRVYLDFGIGKHRKGCGLKRSKSLTNSRIASLVSMPLQETTMFPHSLGKGNRHVTK